jgi:4-hydroxybenzoate polyprenyltransferase
MTGTIGHYLQLMRAPAVFTALSNIFAAHLILTQGEIIWPDLLLLLGSTAALYSGGMTLNDWFDYDVDLLERPGRPLPSGRISRHHALLFGGLLLLAGVGLAALAGTRSFYLALGIVLLVLVYDGVLKRTVAGGLAMGGCRYLNWLLGFSLLPLTGQSLLIPIPIFIYIMALTLLSREEESAKNRSIVIFTATGILLAGLAIIGLGTVSGNAPGWKAVLIVIATGFISYRLWLIYRDFSPANVQATMKLLIFAIIPLDALLVLVFGPSWWALAVLLLLLPGKFLARIMYIT